MLFVLYCARLFVYLHRIITKGDLYELNFS